MDKLLTPFYAEGEINIPASKSYAHRYLIISFIANKPVTIHNVYFSNDTRLTINALTQLGGKFDINQNGDVQFLGREPINKDQVQIKVGTCASTLRLLLPLASSLCDNVIFYGEESLFYRPLSVYEEILYNQNIPFYKGENFLKIKGRMKPENFVIRGDISSQFISGLLFLLASTEDHSKLTISTEVVSKNYADMTIQTLSEFGYDFEENASTYQFINKKETNNNEFYIEKDFSSFANFAILGALGGNISIIGFDVNSLQADKEIINILENCGAIITERNKTFTFKKSTLKPFNINIDNCIDLGPALFVLASFIEGESTITGISRLKIKESDRLNATLEELKKAGVEFESSQDKVIIKGKSTYPGRYVFNPHNDHRVAMAMAVFAVLCEKESTLENAECVDKSYPDFFKDLLSLRK